MSRAPRCDQPMRQYEPAAAAPVPGETTWCGRPAGHNGPHRSAAARSRALARDRQRRRDNGEQINAVRRDRYQRARAAGAGRAEAPRREVESRMNRPVPYGITCGITGAIIAALTGWPYGLPIGVLVVLILLGLRLTWHNRTEIGDDVVTIFCRCCDGHPALPCTCAGDCGRRHCKWATLISDRQFRRELAALLDSNHGENQ